MHAIYDWDNWAVAVAKYDKNDDKYHCFSANKCDNCTQMTHKDQNGQWIIVMQVDKKYKHSYTSYDNLSDWWYWGESGECTMTICD